MALQIANPVVIEKVEKLARAMGVTKTAAVEKAVDRLLSETRAGGPRTDRIDALLAQMDQVPVRPDAFDPMVWDDLGLPR